MTHNNNSNDDFIEKEEPIDFEKIISDIIDHWKWFAIGIVVMLLLGTLYLKHTAPQYKVNASVMVDDDQKGGMSGMLGSSSSSGSSTFGDLGSLLNVKSSVDNELLVLQTRDLMRKVVKDMHLNVTYYQNVFLGKREMYNDRTFEVALSEDADATVSNTYKVTFLNNNQIRLTRSIKDSTDSSFNIKWGDSIPLAKGKFTLIPTANKPALKEDYLFYINPIKPTVQSYLLNLDAQIPNKTVSIINLTLPVEVPAEGEDILNTLIREYITSNRDQKNAYADSTISFINERLGLVNGELSNAEKGLADYKQKNNIADLQAQAAAVINSSSDYEKEKNLIQVQLSVVNTMLDYISDTRNNQRPVPSLITSPDPTFEALLEKYNTLVTQRDRFASNNTENNPGMINLNGQISAAKQDLVNNLRNMKQALSISRNTAVNQNARIGDFIHAAPEKEREFTGLSRNQQVKQTLYLYLLQRREEMSIAKASNIANARVIDSPAAEIAPFKPKKAIIMAACLILGLVIPYGLIFVSNLLNTKITSENDVRTRFPEAILGGVTHINNPHAIDFVKETRSVLSEQFRTLRANIQFTLGVNESKCNTILFTSSMSGEGKSFISLNLAKAFASLGKRTVIVDLDLRKPKLDSNLRLQIRRNIGVSNFLISQINPNDIITQTDDANFDVIFSGPIPPNPTELLQNQRARALISYLKTQYDIVILDAPPFGLVSDASLLATYADSIVYITRENYTYKKQLNLVPELKRTSKKDEIYIILNDIKEKASGRYGYGYGYGYGHGYGHDIKQSRIKKFFKRLTRK